ncbi:hypothetical protein KEM56_000566 [Ascosphaera pollenicola]|nr:hypothetical protein KEM56_000566 [Ascosphaera pollenicola]
MFHKEEVPSTYLNKGQTYMLKIVDKTPFVSGSLPVKYVTSIRISFEFDELRGKAAECWRLWKRTRGRTNNSECSKSNKKQWQAVELVETGADSLYAASASQSNHGSFGLPASAQLVDAQFDGLTVVWSPNQECATTMPQECLIPIRFNFLSTDFMPSKGVKGAPMRLCVKTKVRQSGALSQVLAANSNGHKDFTSPAISVASPAASTPTSATEQGSIGSMINPLDETTNETWYCKLQAFRDHGAERKFQNHRQQIENAIANNSAKLANLMMGVKGDGHSPRGNLGSSPSSDSGAVRGNAGVTKINRRRKCTGATDLIYRVQSKIDALRFALESAEDCIMLSMTSWHQDDDPDAVRPDILNDDQSDVGATQTGIRSEVEASATQPSTGGPLLSNTLLGLHHIAQNVSPIPVRPHSADDRMLGHPLFMSSPNFATTATTVSPYSETQELALSYGIATAHTSPLYPPEDFMQLPMSSIGEQYQPQESLLQYGGFQNQMLGFDDFPMNSPDLIDGFTVYDPLKQDWNEFSDSVPINTTGQVF